MSEKINNTQNNMKFFSFIVCVSVILFLIYALITSVTVGHADNFTDIFYTNSFRGAFTWIKKLDWVGMLVQIVISCFSLFGVALMTIRIMTSMLYLSSKGLWEEVHDLKSSGGESEMFDFGVISMAKSWAQGKAGTGLDAIIGAVLILLPDVKKYSDFGEKSGGKFEEDITMTQYILKIALPTVMVVFFFAMGFNGTLFQALATTVDGMGTIADRAVSVNYAGIVDDLANSHSGYSFAFDIQGTQTGSLQQAVAKDIYGRCVSSVSGLTEEQLYIIGRNVENFVATNIVPGTDAIRMSARINDDVKQALSSSADPVTDKTADTYMGLLRHSCETTANREVTGAVTLSLDIDGAFAGVPNLEATGNTVRYIHVFLRQESRLNGAFANLGTR